MTTTGSSGAMARATPGQGVPGPSSAAAPKRPTTTKPPANVHVAPTATPVGGRSFAAPAMMRILLVPATSSVSPEEFERMTRVVRRIESIHFADLPRSTARSSIPPSSPLARAGEVHLSFVTSYDPSHAFLSPFNIHRSILGVLGLGISDGDPDTTAALEQAPEILRKMHPSAVVHRVFAFDTGASAPQTVDVTSLKKPLGDIAEGDAGDAPLSISDEGEDESKSGDTDARDTSRTSMSSSFSASRNVETPRSSASGAFGRGAEGLYIFPAVRRDLKDVRFYLKTLIPDFVAALADRLETVVRGLQGKPLETPRETLDGDLQPAQQQASPVSPTTAKAQAASGGMGAAASSAASRASALFSSFSAADRDSTSSSSRKVTLSRNSAPAQNLAAVGPTGTGRYAKVRADYYLLVGDLWSALQTYDQCLGLLGKERAMAGSQDSVWYASALEGWAVARVLVARMGGLVEDKAPCLTLPTGTGKEKEKKEYGPPDPDADEKPWDDIVEAYSQALTIYQKCLAPASYLLDTKRSITSDTPRDYTHPLIHTSACLAFSRLLLAIWASGGWNGETFDQLLIGGVPPALAETSRPTQAVYDQHTTSSKIERGDIAAPASQALTNSSTKALKLLDQLHLYSSLAAIFGCIGFARKEAYAIQRLQGLVIVLIAQGIMMQRSHSSASSEALRAGDAAHGTLSTHAFSVGAGHGSDSILVLALQVCQTYGVNINPMPLVKLAQAHILHRASADVKSGKSLSAPSMTRDGAKAHGQGTRDSHYDVDTWRREEEDARKAFDDAANEPAFGWTEQQILVLKDTIAICEMLQDKEALLFFALLLLRDFWPFLGFEEQFKLKDGVNKIMADLDETEKGSRLRYWGPRDILTSIILEPNAATMPRKTRIEEGTGGGGIENGRPHVSAAWKEKRKGPGIPSQSASDVLVQDETASFIVFLQNPLMIPLEIESLRLELVGTGNFPPTFETTERKGIILPPLCFHGIRLTGIPRGEGKMTVKGVSIKLPWCAERLFQLQHPQASNEKSVWKSKNDIDDRHTRTKRYGLDARSDASVGRPRTIHSQSSSQEAPWTVPVIAKVPLVNLQPASTALRNGAVVMCDGEDRVVTLTLYNQSELPIDYLRFIFDDSAQRDAVDLLAEGQLHVADTFELEHDLIHRPFITLVDGKAQADRRIGPRQRKTYTFSLHGKVDVTQASIRIEYGNAAASRELGRSDVWIRDAVFGFDVRVLPTLFLDSLEITSLPPAHFPIGANSSLVKANGQEGGDEEENDDEDGTMLVAFAVHNLHNSPVELSLRAEEVVTRGQTDESRSTIVERLAPHASARVHMVMRRFPRSAWTKHHKPIPRLIERQFILSRNKKSALEEEHERLLFWARQALLSRLSPISAASGNIDIGVPLAGPSAAITPQSNCTWTDLQSGRTGSVSLAGLRQDDVRLIQGLYGEPIAATLSLSSQSEPPTFTLPQEQGDRKTIFNVQAHDFIDLEVVIRNKAERSICVNYKLLVTTDDRQTTQQVSMRQQEQQTPTQHFICTSGHTAGRITIKTRDLLASDYASATSSFITGVCFLAKGTFHVSLILEEDRSTLAENDGDISGTEPRQPRQAASACESIVVHVA